MFSARSLCPKTPPEGDWVPLIGEVLTSEPVRLRKSSGEAEAMFNSGISK